MQWLQCKLPQKPGVVCFRAKGGQFLLSGEPQHSRKKVILNTYTIVRAFDSAFDSWAIIISGWSAWMIRTGLPNIALMALIYKPGIASIVTIQSIWEHANLCNFHGRLDLGKQYNCMKVKPNLMFKLKQHWLLVH